MSNGAVIKSVPPCAESKEAVDPPGTTASSATSGEHRVSGGPLAVATGFVMGVSMRPPVKVDRNRGAGSNIFRRLRILTNWTQAYAAAQFNVSERFWRDLEKGKDPEAIKLFNRVASYVEELESKRRTG